MTRLRNSVHDRIARRARVLEAEGRIAPAVRVQPGTVRSRRAGYVLWRVRQIVNGQRRTREQAAATFAGKPWAARAETAGASGGWYVWEVPEEAMQETPVASEAKLARNDQACRSVDCHGKASPGKTRARKGRKAIK